MLAVPAYEAFWEWGSAV